MAEGRAERRGGGGGDDASRAGPQEGRRSEVRLPPPART